MRKRPVMATGGHEGRVVMFGWTAEVRPDEKGGITLDKAQLLLRWGDRGLGQMASEGPNTAHCRVGPQVPRLWLADVRSITDVAPAAVAKWEARPWC